MPIRTLGPTRVVAAVTATTVFVATMIGGCGADRATNPALAPSARVPTSLAFDGGGQVVLAGRFFSSPIAIVLDSAGAGVSDVRVTFTASGSGSVQPTERLTDANGRAGTTWLSGSGENIVTASAPGLRSAGISSYGIDSSSAALYELVDVEPAYVVDLAGTLLLGNGRFYTTVRCKAPATCADSGWGTYGISGSSLSLSYQNQFLQYWNSFSDNQESGVVRGDTLQLNQSDGMWAPYSFRLSFVFRGGPRP
jgi:hypothetical protein